MNAPILTRRPRVAWAAALALFVLPLAGRADTVVDFDDLPLAPGSYWRGPDPSGTVSTTVDDSYTSITTSGAFTSHGTAFHNQFSRNLYNGEFLYDTWGGFAYSNMQDSTTIGFGNQYSAYTGTGHGDGADNYAIGNGYHDLAANFGNFDPFNPADTAHLLGLPSIDLASGFEALGMYVTNTTYTALSMKYGDTMPGGFGRKFTTGDWLKLSIYGINAAGKALETSIDFLLADYSTTSDADLAIVNQWTWIDLSSLKGAVSLHFNISSSDVGEWGMNTPGYFAMDDLTLRPLAGPPSAVPEPSTLALAAIGLGLVAGGAAHKRRRPASR